MQNKFSQILIDLFYTSNQQISAKDNNKQISILKKYFTNSSIFVLWNLSPKNRLYLVQPRYNCKTTQKNTISLEIKIWENFANTKRNTVDNSLQFFNLHSIYSFNLFRKKFFFIGHSLRITHHLYLIKYLKNLNKLMTYAQNSILSWRIGFTL